MFSCKKVSELKCEAEVRRLSLSEKLGLRLHMVVCAGCRQIEKQMEFIRRASTRAGQQHLSDNCDHCLSEPAKKRIEAAISEQDKSDK